MAIITKHTLSKLCSDLDLDFKASASDFQTTVFNDSQVFYLLNSKQNVYLFTYASILKDIDGFKADYFQYVPEKEDKFLYVKEKLGKYKYHLSSECPMLLNDFKDFIIPKAIRDLGVDEINEFRRWFEQKQFSFLHAINQITLDDIMFQINEKYVQMYNLKPFGPETGIYQNIPNSGKSHVEESFDFNEFQLELNEIIKQLDEEFTDSNWRKFSKFASLRNEKESVISQKLGEAFSDVDLIKRFGINTIQKKLNTAYSLKYRLINSLIKYLRWYHKFDKIDFDSKTLEDFGLDCCKHCAKFNLTSGN
jgi:hypothetical protein